MSIFRRNHSAQFKAKVALSAYKGDQTAGELMTQYKVSSGQLSTWKKRLVEGASQLFEGGGKPTLRDEATLTAPLYEEIGRLKMELDWLKKKLEAPR
jgi:transposase-like protein